MKITFTYSPEELQEMTNTMNTFADAGDEFSEMAAMGMNILREQGKFEQTHGTLSIYGGINNIGGKITYELDEKAFCAGMHTAAAFAETWVDTIEYLKALATVLQIKRILSNVKSMFTAVKKSFNGEDPAMDEEESVRLDENDPEVK